MNFKFMSFFKSAFAANLVAFCGYVVFSGSLLAQSEITLPRSDGKGDFKAMVFPLTADTAVSIGVVGAEVEKLKSGDETPKIIAHDSESRVLLLGIPAPENSILPEMGNGLALQAGDSVYTDVKKGGKMGRVVTWVSMFDQEYLPFAFLRVMFDDEVVSVGQPLYDAEGKLVAVAHQATPGKGTSCYAVPVEVIQRVMGEVKRERPIRRSWVGCHMDAPNTFPKVVGIRPDSPASKAGLMKGDVLLQIGPRTVRNYDDVVNAFFYLLADEEVDFKVLRGTKIMDLKVTPVADPRYALGKS